MFYGMVAIIRNIRITAMEDFPTINSKEYKSDKPVEAKEAGQFTNFSKQQKREIKKLARKEMKLQTRLRNIERSHDRTLAIALDKARKRERELKQAGQHNVLNPLGESIIRAFKEHIMFLDFNSLRALFPKYYRNNQDYWFFSALAKYSNNITEFVLNKYGSSLATLVVPEDMLVATLFGVDAPKCVKTMVADAIVVCNYLKGFKNTCPKNRTTYLSLMSETQKELDNFLEGKDKMRISALALAYLSNPYNFWSFGTTVLYRYNIQNFDRRLNNLDGEAQMFSAVTQTFGNFKSWFYGDDTRDGVYSKFLIHSKRVLQDMIGKINSCASNSAKFLETIGTSFFDALKNIVTPLFVSLAQLLGPMASWVSSILDAIKRSIETAWTILDGLGLMFPMFRFLFFPFIVVLITNSIFAILAHICLNYNDTFATVLATFGHKVATAFANLRTWFFPQEVPIAQFGYDEMAKPMGGLVTLGLALFAGFGPSEGSRQTTDFLRTAGMSKSLWEFVSGNAKGLLCTIYEAVTGKSSLWLEGDLFDSSRLVVEYDALIVQHSDLIAAGLNDNAVYAKLEDLEKQFTNTYGKILFLRKSPSSNPIFFRKYEALKEIMTSIRLSRNLGIPREKPMVMLFYGAAGKGKTTAMDILKKWFWNGESIMRPSQFPNKYNGSQNFTVNLASEYMDTYHGQFFCTIPEFLQNKDASVRAEQAARFINFADTTLCPVNMAECTQKNRVFFDSKIIMMNSNVTSLNQVAVESTDAIARRVDMALTINKVTFIDKPDVDWTRNDYKRAWQFRLHKKIDGKATNPAFWKHITNCMKKPNADFFDMDIIQVLDVMAGWYHEPKRTNMTVIPELPPAQFGSSSSYEQPEGKGKEVERSGMLGEIEGEPTTSPGSDGDLSSLSDTVEFLISTGLNESHVSIASESESLRKCEVIEKTNADLEGIISGRNIDFHKDDPTEKDRVVADLRAELNDWADRQQAIWGEEVPSTGVSSNDSWPYGFDSEEKMKSEHIALGNHVKSKTICIEDFSLETHLALIEDRKIEIEMQLDFKHDLAYHAAVHFSDRFYCLDDGSLISNRFAEFGWEGLPKEMLQEFYTERSYVKDVRTWGNMPDVTLTYQIWASQIWPLVKELYMADQAIKATCDKIGPMSRARVNFKKWILRNTHDNIRDYDDVMKVIVANSFKSDDMDRYWMEARRDTVSNLAHVTDSVFEVLSSCLYAQYDTGMTKVQEAAYASWYFRLEDKQRVYFDTMRNRAEIKLSEWRGWDIAFSAVSVASMALIASTTMAIVYTALKSLFESIRRAYRGLVGKEEDPGQPDPMTDILSLGEAQGTVYGKYTLEEGFKNAKKQKHVKRLDRESIMKHRKPVAQGNMHSTDQASPILSKIGNNYRYMKMVLKNGAECKGLMLCYHNKCGVIAGHAYAAFKEDMEYFRICHYTSAAEPIHTYPVSSLVFKEDTERDLVMVSWSMMLPNVVNLLSYIKRDFEEAPKVDRMEVKPNKRDLLITNLNVVIRDRINTYFRAQHGGKTYENRPTILAPWLVKNAEGQAGDCMLPYVSRYKVDSNGKGTTCAQLVFLHVGRIGKDAIVVPVHSPEEIEDFCPSGKNFKGIEEPVAQFVKEVVADKDLGKGIARYASLTKSTTLATNSQLTPSLLFDTRDENDEPLLPVERIPARLSPFVNGDNIIAPTTISLGKYGDVGSVFVPKGVYSRLMKEDVYCKTFFPDLKFNGYKRATVKEVLFGGYFFGNSHLKRDASMGGGYSLLNIKRKDIFCPEDKYIDRDILDEIEAKVIELQDSYDVPPLVAKIQQKANETLPYEEVMENGKVRFFSMGEFVYLVATLTYMLPIMTWCKDHRDHTTNTCGMNPYKREWGNIYKRLSIFGKDGIMELDGKRFDRAIPSIAAERFAKDLCALVEHSGDDKVKNALTNIALALPQALYIIWDSVFYTCRGQPSGNGCTTFYNGWVDEFIYRSVYNVLVENSHLDEWSFDTNVVCIFYGDDALVGVNTKVREMFNMLTFGEVANVMYGMTFTAGDKSAATEKFVHLDSAQFLKRQFKNWGNGLVQCPLEKASIHSMLNFVSDDLDPKEAMLGNFDSAMFEAFRHGKEYHDHICRVISRVCKEHDLNYTCPSYHECVSRWVKDYKN